MPKDADTKAQHSGGTLRRPPAAVVCADGEQGGRASSCGAVPIAVPAGACLRLELPGAAICARPPNVCGLAEYQPQHGARISRTFVNIETDVNVLEKCRFFSTISGEIHLYRFQDRAMRFKMVSFLGHNTHGGQSYGARLATDIYALPSCTTVLICDHLASCLADKLINAAKGSSDSYAVKKKDDS